ncbi:transposase [Metallosphaera tengchongensis]|uniref:transposase n=1 Tax=Metallosphaera tengchongensis TaxID=1532350 RepID=UPI001C2EF473|nr:transposase [Metallosphaera tengchongensis]
MFNLYEYGIKVFLVVEYMLQGSAPYNVVERGPMGVINSPIGHRLHSDVNGALNIMKLGVKKTANALKKLLYSLVTSNGINPVNGSNAQDLSRTPTL